MEIKRFGFGFRFPAETEERVILDLAAKTFGYHDVAGCNAYFAEPLSDEDLPYPTVILFFSGLSLKRARKLFAAAKNSTPFLCALSPYRPFLQTNYLKNCECVKELGAVSEDGAMRTADGVETARFQVFAAPKTDLRRPRFLIIGTEDTTGRDALTVCHDAAGKLMKKHPDATVKLIPASNTAKGMLDALMAAMKGRYAKAKEGYLGLLPDESAVIDESYGEYETADSKRLGRMAALAVKFGCRNLMVAADGSYMHDFGNGCAEAFHEEFPDGCPEGVRFAILQADPAGEPMTAFPALPNLQVLCQMDVILDAFGIWRRIREGCNVVWAVTERGESDLRIRKNVEALSKQYHRKLYRYEAEAEKRDANLNES